MGLLSFEEGLGIAAPAEDKTAAPATQGKQLLSFEDGLGIPPPAEPPSLGGFLRSPESWKRMAGDVGKVALAGADMILGVPGQILGVGADIGVRGRALLGGESRRVQDAAAEEARAMIPEGLSAPLQTLNKYLTGAEPWNQDAVDKWITKGTDALEKASGGALTSGGAKSVLNAFMAAGGAHAGDAIVKTALAKPELQFVGARESYAPGEELPPADVPPPKRPGPDVVVMEKKAQVKKLFDDAKRETSPLNVPDAAAVSDMFDRVRRGDPAPDAGTERAAAAKPQYFPPPLEPVARTRMQEPPLIGVEPPENLASAQQKLVDGKGFDMTAAEKLALKKAGQNGQRLVDQYGKPLALGALAMGALAGMDLSNEERAGLGLGIGMTMGPKGQRGGEIPLGWSAADLHPYSFPSLDSIAKGATEVAKSKIEARLKNEAIPEAERAIIKRVLATAPGDSISTRALVDGVKEETSGFKLRTQKTGQYADYGLENIDRPERGGYAFGDEGSAQHPLAAKTTLYKLPEGSAASDANHFSEPDLFGWTRSFREDGKRHVVELQSDLAQHAKGGLEGEALEAALKERETVEKTVHDYHAKMAADRLDGIVKPVSAAMMDADTRLAELNTAIESSAVSSQLSPVLKNWPRRLIREELRQEALAGGDSVRFATADTVAKVEGWPRAVDAWEHNQTLLKEQVQREQRYVKQFETHLKQDPEAPGVALRLKRAQAYVQELQEQLAEPRPEPSKIHNPGHQSIYDRYAGPITRYLKGLGGKEVTDAEGHSWIEVPTKSVLHDTPKGPAIKMLGSADRKVVAVMAAAGIGGAVAAQDPSLGLGLAAAGLGIIGTGRLAGKNLIDTFRAGAAPDAPKIAKLERDLAASQLYEANAGTLKRALRSYEGKGIDVEELVQRTLMKGFASLDKPADAPGGFRGDAKFSSFLFGNAQNLAKDAWRAGERGLKTEDLTPELVDRAYGHSATPEKAALNKALTEKMVAAIERLPDKLREPFEMAELEGLTDLEIGERLGIDRAAARKAIYNARQELRQSLRAYSDKESGFADPKTLAGIAALAGGAALGAYWNPEHPVVGGLYGAGAGVLLMNAKPAKWVEAYRKARLEGPRVDVSELINQQAYAVKVGMRAVQQTLWEVEKVAPSAERRAAIRDYLVGEKPVVLTPEEKGAAAKVREFYDALGKVALDAGVIDKVIEDYVTRQWEGGAPGTKLVGNNMTQSSPFGKPRGYRTEAEAEAAGLRLKTKDISQVLQDYSGSINRAIANKQLVEVLKQGSTPEGTRFLMKEGKAPADYVRVDSPQLKGWLAHPDIVPDLKHVFSLKDPGAVIGALDALNATQKRVAVMTSMFHPMALEHALIGAMPVLKSPLLGAKAFGQSFAPMIFGESVVIRQLREGGLGDSIDKLMKGGLEFSIEREGKATSTEDASQSMYKGLDTMSKMMDEAVPGLGKHTLGHVMELNHLFDRAMWGRFHTTLKIMVAEAKASDLLRNNSRDVKSLMSEAEAYKQASSFTNDLFGGLNWYGVASEFKSRLGRELMMSATSPMGRLGMRLVLFAPDWTISTTRAFVKAFGPTGRAAGTGAVLGSQLVTDDFDSKLKGAGLGAVLGFGAGKALGLKGTEGSGIRGMIPEELGGKAMNITDLHRQYIVRSALIYTLIADSANYAMSGHHLWDNKDPTRIDMGNGQTLVASKHFMEPFHWLLDPKKQAMGKTSFLVKESAAQITDKEYWSATGAPRLGGKIFDENGFPVKKDITLGQRAQHVAKQFVPISLQGVENSTPQSLGLNALGMPVYGKSEEMKAAERDATKARTSTPEYKAEAKRRAIQARIDRREREASK